jgi:hypothetical protein
MGTDRGDRRPSSRGSRRIFKLPETMKSQYGQEEIEGRQKARLGKTRCSRAREISRENQRLGSAFEHYLANRLRMEIQPGSGCGRFKKEDLVDEEWMGQAKSTKKSSITLKYEDLDKLRRHAGEQRKLPAFFVGFEGGPGFVDQQVWALVPLPTWTATRSIFKRKV